MLTPLHLKILLHCHTSGEDWQYLSPVHREYRDDLAGLGLIEPCDAPKNWTTSERGKVFVEGLLSHPLPIQKWVMPK